MATREQYIEWLEQAELAMLKLATTGLPQTIAYGSKSISYSNANAYELEKIISYLRKHAGGRTTIPIVMKEDR
jgi:hypothetical protein